MSEAGTAVPKPAPRPGRCPATAVAEPRRELKVSGHLMTLDTGLFCVFQAPGTPAANDWSGLPGVRISLPPGPAGRPDAVSISTFRDDGWMNGSDTAALIRVAEGPAQVLVTVYQAPGGATRERAASAGDAAGRGTRCRAASGRCQGRRKRPWCQRKMPMLWRTSSAPAMSPASSATGSARAAASNGSRASAWRRATASSRRTSNIRRCWAAAGCRLGSRAASSAAAAAWRCRCSASRSG